MLLAASGLNCGRRTCFSRVLNDRFIEIYVCLTYVSCLTLNVILVYRTVVQVDGEPWKQAPAEITVKLHNQARFFSKCWDIVFFGGGGGEREIGPAGGTCTAA